MSDYTLYGLAKKIFDTPFQMKLTATEKDTLIESQKEIEVINAQPVGGYDINGVLWNVSSPMEAYIKSAMQHKTALTGDDEYDKVLMGIPQAVNLSINQMVELWDTMATLRFVSASDVVDVFETIDLYLEKIEDASWLSPNYRKPPEEDMRKLRALLEAIRDRADTIMVASEDHTGWNSLMDWFAPTAFIPGEAKVTSTVPQKRSLRDVAHVNKDDPFAFLL